MFSIIRDTVNDFFKTLLFRKAASLTFISMFTIIPCLAFVIIASNTCGLDAETMSLVERFSNLFGIEEESTLAINSYITESLRFGSVGFIIGIPFLFWSVCGTYNEIERMFDEIFEIEAQVSNDSKQNSIFDIAKDFLSALVKKIKKGTKAIFAITATLLVVVATNRALGEIEEYVFYLEGFVAIMFLLSLSYIYIPNTKSIENKKAIYIAAVISLLLVLTTLLFKYLTKLCFSYDKVYGSLLGCMMVFLLYVRIVWAEVLFGARLLFQFQYGQSKSKIDIDLNKIVQIDKEAVLLYVAESISSITPANKREANFGFLITKITDKAVEWHIDKRITLWSINKLMSAGFMEKNNINGEERYKVEKLNLKPEELLKVLNENIGDKDKLKELFTDEQTLKTVTKIKEHISRLYENNSIEPQQLG